MIPDRKLNQAIRQAIQAEMDELEISPREVDEAWVLFKQRISGNTKPQPRPYIRIRPWAAVAVAVLLFLLGGALLPSGTALGKIVLGYFQSIRTTGQNPVVTVDSGLGGENKRPGTEPGQTGPSLTLQEAQERVPFAIEVPTVLPDGAVLTKISVEEPIPKKVLTWLTYEWNGGWLEVSQMIMLGESRESANYDGDRYRVEEIEVSGLPGRLVIPSDQRAPTAVSWVEGDVAYQVRGNLKREELLRTAESLSPFSN